MARVTLQSIAEEVGVSIAAVSMALNDKPGVSDEMRAKIIQIALQKGYKIKNREVVQREQSKRPLHVVLMDHTFESVEVPLSYADAGRALIRGVESVCVQQNVYLDINSSREPLSWGPEMDVDGLICVQGALPPDKRTMLECCALPLVVTGGPLTVGRFNSVTYDYRGVMVDIVRRLKAAGHRHIALVRYDRDGSNFIERWMGWMDAVQLEGLNCAGDFKYEDADDETVRDQVLMERLMVWLAGEAKEATAFVCVTDFLALSLTKALRAIGREPGVDAAVVGFDDSPFARISEPPLASVRLREEYVGQQAMYRLLELIRQPNQDYMHSYIPMEFIDRESICEI